jgi:hypothetical protein
MLGFYKTMDKPKPIVKLDLDHYKSLLEIVKFHRLDAQFAQQLAATAFRETKRPRKGRCLREPTCVVPNNPQLHLIS